MKDEIKEIIENVKKCCDITKEQNFIVYQRQDILKLLDYITNLQEELKYQKQAEIEYNEKHTKLMKKYKKLQRENEKLKELDENYPIEEQLEEALKWKNIYKSRIDKANEYIEENTRWFDSEYAKIYGELCDCAGAKCDRLEVLINPSNLSKILGGDDKDVKD